MKTFTWIILIILIIALIWFYSRQHKYNNNNEEKYESRADKEYNEVFGYEDTPESRIALRVALEQEETPNPPAQNAFIIGDLLEFNYDQHDVALMYYQDAIDRIVERPADPHAHHIIDRIADIVPQIDIAPAKTKTREFAKKFKEMEDDKPVINIKSDPQNVHDSQVNIELKNIYHNLVEKNSFDDINADTKSLEKFIGELPPNKRKRALKTYEYMHGHNSAVGAQEEMVLLEVWKRVNSNQNKSRQKELKEAFADALVDSTDDNGYTVCSGGRCARILSSLTLLDTDKKIAEPIKSKEILRSEIMSKAHKILNEAIDTHPQGADYVAGDDAPKFESDVKKIIAKTIKDDYAGKEIKDLDELIADAQAGV